MVGFDGPSGGVAVTNVMRVWEPCDHGGFMRHWWFEGELSERVECLGGREIVLREMTMLDTWDGQTVYVVVNE